MPKIQWVGLLSALRDHLFDRLRIARADAHDVNAAKQAERLADAERVRAQADSGNGPVIFSGKGAGLYSASLPDLPPLRPASRTLAPEPVEEPGRGE